MFNPKLDLKKLLGVVNLDLRTIRTETYRRKRFGGIKRFCLKEMTDAKIFAEINE